MYVCMYVCMYVHVLPCQWVEFTELSSTCVERGVDVPLCLLPSYSYDITTSEITSFIRIPLEYVDKVEIGECAH